MNRHEQRTLTTLKIKMQSLNASQIIDHLWSEGILSRKEIERIGIRNEFKRRTTNGESRCRAMESLATEFGCSYEKVRATIYKKE
ncbi:MAG: hypothetical protein IJ348_06910 [Alistipes sp.]|nr:hypothetical protein [Alistipes sp.]